MVITCRRKLIGENSKKKLLPRSNATLFYVQCNEKKRKKNNSTFQTSCTYSRNNKDIPRTLNMKLRYYINITKMEEGKWRNRFSLCRDVRKETTAAIILEIFHSLYISRVNKTCSTLFPFHTQGDEGILKGFVNIKRIYVISQTFDLEMKISFLEKIPYLRYNTRVFSWSIPHRITKTEFS